jgi:hypothetical protein
VSDFPVHTITVTRISYEMPRGNFLTEPPVCEYTINHGVCELRGDECLVESQVQEMGLHAALFGVWDTWELLNRIEVKDYQVRGWVSKFDVPGEPVEWDAGIEEVGDEDA